MFERILDQGIYSLSDNYFFKDILLVNIDDLITNKGQFGFISWSNYRKKNFVVLLINLKEELKQKELEKRYTEDDFDLSSKINMILYQMSIIEMINGQ
tara:strand:+ start:148 stop:441 length:294 start_codon:yes stop_codon:yes gene_type:complete